MSMIDPSNRPDDHERAMREFADYCDPSGNLDFSAEKPYNAPAEISGEESHLPLQFRTIPGPHAEGENAAEEWRAMYHRESAHGQRMARRTLIVGLLNGAAIALSIVAIILTIIHR